MLPLLLPLASLLLMFVVVAVVIAAAVNVVNVVFLLLSVVAVLLLLVVVMFVGCVRLLLPFGVYIGLFKAIVFMCFVGFVLLVFSIVGCLCCWW